MGIYTVGRNNGRTLPIIGVQIGRNIGRGFLAILVLFFIGCASPRAVTIKHESTPSLSEVTQTDQQRKGAPVEEKKTAAPADMQRRREPADQETIALLELLKNKKIITEEEAAQIAGRATTEEAGKPGAPETGETKKSLEKMKEEISSDVTNELLRQVWTINNTLKEKEKRLRFGGDIRLRYEKDLFDPNNAILFQPSNPTQPMNTTSNQSRFKYRVRFGVEAQVNDRVEAVVRISTGNTSNPVSENDTMGNYMNKDSVVFDLAYVKWQPWKPVSLYGGRFPNLFVFSDLVWSKDLYFTGFALQAKTPNAYTESWKPFLTAGAFPLGYDDVNYSQRSKWLLAGQVGLERKNNNGISAKIGAAYYDFKNITGVLSSPANPTQYSWTAPQFQQKGNTLFNINPLFPGTPGSVPLLALAAEYREADVTGVLDIGYWDPVHIVLLGDYVRNIAFDQADVSQKTGNPNVPKDIVGYQIQLSVGYPTIQESGQWKLSFAKKYLEADAVVDAFTDPDFHLGGTNATGWIFQADIGLMKNCWLTAKWLTADEIDGPPLSIDVLQIDFNARF